MNIDDDQFLIKLKQLRFTDAQIANRLRITPEEVGRRWAELLTVAAAVEKNGHWHLVNTFSLMSHQYQLLGETMKAIGGQVCKGPSLDEVRAVIANGPPETAAERLVETFVVMNPFTPLATSDIPVQDNRS